METTTQLARPGLTHGRSLPSAAGRHLLPPYPDGAVHEGAGGEHHRRGQKAHPKKSAHLHNRGRTRTQAQRRRVCRGADRRRPRTGLHQVYHLLRSISASSAPMQNPETVFASDTSLGLHSAQVATMLEQGTPDPWVRNNSSLRSARMWGGGGPMYP